jgi:ubiquinone/menaquinone biosynthesis C-methylase UbiE
MKEINPQNKEQINIHSRLALEQGRKKRSDCYRIFSKYWNEQYLSYLGQSRQAILDVGCGTGDLTRALSYRGKITIGIDISGPMINTAKSMTDPSRNIIWATCTGESLPFANSVFDVVCFRGALHHMSDAFSGLKEAFRVLKNGGLMMLSEPNDDSVFLRIPRKIVSMKMARFGADHKAFRSEKWIKTIQNAGFTVVSKKYFSFLSQPLCGMDDVLSLLSICPFPRSVANLLVQFDELCSRLPYIKRQSFDLFMVLRKN